MTIGLTLKFWAYRILDKALEKPKSIKMATTLISLVSKAMLKILQARLQQYVNRELPDVQTGF